MVATKLLFLFASIAVVNCRYFYLNELPSEEDLNHNIMVDDPEDKMFQEEIESVHPGYLRHIRNRRQIRGVVNTNPSGSFNLNARAPLFSGSRNSLSAVAGIDSLRPGGKFGSVSGGLAYDHM